MAIEAYILRARESEPHTRFRLRSRMRRTEKNTRLRQRSARAEWEDSLENGSRCRSIVAATDDQPRCCYTSAGSTIFERCLSGLDQIYSYEFQKALDSSPKRSLLAAVASRSATPKIRVFAVGLLVGAFVRPPRYPRRRARAERRLGIAMAPIFSWQDAFNVSASSKSHSTERNLKIQRLDLECA